MARPSTTTKLHAAAGLAMGLATSIQHGCGTQPAYAIGVHAAVASDDDLLPKTGGFSKASPVAPGASPTSSPKPADQPPRTDLAKSKP